MQTKFDQSIVYYLDVKDPHIRAAVLSYLGSRLGFLSANHGKPRTEIPKRYVNSRDGIVASGYDGANYLDLNNFSTEEGPWCFHNCFRIYARQYKVLDFFKDFELVKEIVDWLLIPFDSPIKIENHIVAFKPDGVQVGCTFVSKETILKIAERLKNSV